LKFAWRVLFFRFWVKGVSAITIPPIAIGNQLGESHILLRTLVCRALSAAFVHEKVRVIPIGD
jgi:hypothetical protein